ncbi:hypothetical protein FRC18_007703 [Serendipita sp. 400]|nr:hypothetical protein FRC18_007703 [Serendipita sp. 400]
MYERAQKGHKPVTSASIPLQLANDAFYHNPNTDLSHKYAFLSTNFHSNLPSRMDHSQPNPVDQGSVLDHRSFSFAAENLSRTISEQIKSCGVDVVNLTLKSRLLMLLTPLQSLSRHLDDRRAFCSPNTLNIVLKSEAIKLRGRSVLQSFINTLTHCDKTLRDLDLSSLKSSIESFTTSFTVQSESKDDTLPYQQSIILTKLMVARRTLECTLDSFKDASSLFVDQWLPLTEQAEQQSNLSMVPEAVFIRSWQENEFQLSPCVQHFQVEWVHSYDGRVETLGKEYVLLKAQKLKNGGKLDRNDNIELERDLFNNFQYLQCPASVNDSMALIPTEPRSTWDVMNGHTTAISGRRKTYLRISLLGTVNQGKSSFVNAMLEEILLHNASGSSTSWPMLVRHVPGMKEPVLNVKPGHFRRFLAVFQEVKPSRLTSGPDYEWIQSFADKDRRLIEKFEDGDLSFQSPVRGFQNILQAVTNINLLVRWSFKLKPEERDSPFSDKDWPVIEIEFDRWKGKDYLVELLDIPGVEDEATTREQRAYLLPHHVWDMAVRSNPDGSIFFTRCGLGTHPGTNGILQRSRVLTREKPLATYLTHGDGDNEWKKSIDPVNTIVYGSTSDEYERCCVADAGYYVSLLNLRRICQDDLSPQLTSFDKIMTNNICRTAPFRILGENGIVNYLEEYETKKRWMNKLDREIGARHWHNVPSHFERYVVHDGLDRRQLNNLLALDLYLKTVVATYQNLISSVIDQRQQDGRDRASSELQIFTKSATERIRQWALDTDMDKERGKASVRTAINSLKSKALGTIQSTVEGISGFSGTAKIIMFRNKKEAEDRLTKALELATTALQAIQTGHVANIRALANDAWTSVLLSLAGKLNEIDQMPNLREDITSTLNRRATEMKQAIDHMVMSLILQRMVKSSGDHVEKSEIEATLAEDARWEYAISVHTGRPIPFSRTKLDILGEAEVTGYMYRPPVSGTMMKTLTGDNLLEHLEELQGGQFCIPSDVLVKLMEEGLLNPWLDVEEKESGTTYIGVIEMAKQVARSEATDKLDQRQKHEDGNLKRVRLDDNVLRDLIVVRARCVAMRGAIKQLCRNWCAILDGRILSSDLLETISNEDELKALTRGLAKTRLTEANTPVETVSFDC